MVADMVPAADFRGHAARIRDESADALPERMVAGAVLRVEGRQKEERCDMNRNILVSATATAALLAFAGVAAADTMVSATTDLNVRAGPGPEYQVIGMLGAGQDAPLTGCLKDSRWCTVATQDGNGWVYSDYLTTEDQGQRVVLAERPADVAVPVVTYDGPSPAGGMVAGAAAGATAGAIVAGPVGAAVGGVAGAATGGTVQAAVEPPREVRTYVVDHSVEPIYLNGEVVVGAGLPENVQLAEIPDYRYRYVDVNGQPVLVDPQTRRIVYIVRH
jgi:uncharacterized protein YraI